LAVATGESPGKRSAGVRVSSALWRRPWAKGAALLTPPLAWFLVIYLSSLAVLLVTAFWGLNEFTGNVVKTWSLDNFKTIFGDPAYRAIIFRTIYMAAGVTVVDAVIAFPFAYFMARVASLRTQRVLFVAVLIPLWASYIARIYAWLLIFSHDGLLNWAAHKIGLSAYLAYTNWAMFIVFCYVWLPFMILPVYAALERIPDSYLEASSDLGGRQWRTLRSVILPMALPGIVAGSIFTFSLTLGDYITPFLVGGTGSSFIGNVVYENVGVAGNIPLAAALAVVPVVIMAIYLWVAKRLGAFEAM
jgi:putative spermidine/putrescine transport system permease protein